MSFILSDNPRYHGWTVKPILVSKRLRGGRYDVSIKLLTHLMFFNSFLNEEMLLHVIIITCRRGSCRLIICGGPPRMLLLQMARGQLQHRGTATPIDLWVEQTMMVLHLDLLLILLFLWGWPRQPFLDITQPFPANVGVWLHLTGLWSLSSGCYEESTAACFTSPWWFSVERKLLTSFLHITLIIRIVFNTILLYLYGVPGFLRIVLIICSTHLYNMMWVWCLMVWWRFIIIW